jgi:hypothetical protein
MGPMITTILLAFGVVILALALLGIGWLITGKVRIIRGACGMDPNKVRDERCGRKISCEICKKPTDIKDKEEKLTEEEEND